MKKTISGLLIILTTCYIVSAQVFVDFETPETTPVLNAEGDFGVVANPDKSGINISDSVGYYNKLSGNWHYVDMEYPDTFDIGSNNTLTFKLHTSTEGRIFAKFWIGDQILIEEWAPEYEFKPTPNMWVECTMDLTPAMNTGFTLLQLAASVDNEAEAEVYFDDVELSNPNAASGDPVAKISLSGNKIETGDTVYFDASGSFDYDGTIERYDWDFGDGTIDSGIVAKHVYAVDSVYTVKLQLTDNEDKKGIKEVNVFVVQPGEKLSKLKFVSDSPETNEKTEAIFNIMRNYDNVYNPDEITVDAIISLPGADTMILPCFYYMKGVVSNGQWSLDSTKQSWMLRFSSPEAGLHTVTLRLEDNEGEMFSGEFSINISPGSTKGIIGSDSVNRQFYRHTTGEPYFPAGINVSWDNIDDYNTILTNLSQGNASLFRFWQTPFWELAMEWSEMTSYEGLGRYNQLAAAVSDSLIELCEELNMNMQLVLFQHGMFSENVDAMWDECPYNLANGGFVSNAEEYFRNDSCKHYTKKVIRYIVARWAYSPNIFAWELINEVQWTGVSGSQSSQWFPGVLQWHDEIGKYLESIDPYNHIQTTSADNSQLYLLDTISSLDNVQYHNYSANLVNNIINYDNEFKDGLANKSIINGEYGTEITEVPIGMQQQIIWNSIMTQVPHFMWLWDDYKTAQWANLFFMPGRYLQNEDFAKEGQLSDYNFNADAADADLNTLGFKSDSNFYGHVYDVGYGSNISDAVMKLENIPFAKYKISYYLSDTYEILEEDSVSLISLVNNINIPEFDNGIAFKIKHQAEYTLPIAIAGRDTIVTPGTTLNLSGSLSVNPSGLPLQYLWTIEDKPSGSTMSIADNTLENISLTFDASGSYTIGLTVNDTENTSIPDYIDIIASNRPIADAGEDITVRTNQFNYLDGTGSYDPDGDDLTYLWSIVSTPVGSTSASLLWDTRAEPIFFPDVDGEYVIRLIVNDGVSDSDPDEIVVTATLVSDVKNSHVNTEITIHPNPVKDIVYVNLGNEPEDVSINLTDMQGKSLLLNEYKNTNRIELNMGEYNLNKGIYIIEVITDNDKVLHKILYQGQ